MPTSPLSQRTPSRAPIEVDSPQLPPAHNAIHPDGTITVSGSVPAVSGIKKIRLKICRPGQVPDPSDPDVIETPVSAGDTFSVQDVRNARGNLAGTEENHLFLWGYDEQGTLLDTRPAYPFLGQCVASVPVTVNATCCLWFAWAPCGVKLVGPEGELGDGYRPKGLTVPTDATAVTITAQGEWRHHPLEPNNNRTSGPDGLDPAQHANATRNLENAAYQSAAYGSSGINPLETNLNRLVGLWQDTETEPGGGDQVELGTGPTVLEATGKCKLFLGFHDGRHWTNNEGSVEVTVTWS